MTGALSFAERNSSKRLLHWGRPPRAAETASKLPARQLRRILIAEIARDPGFKVLTDDGSTVDILVAYTREASDWVKNHGYHLQAEIGNMIADANNAFAVSGIQPRLPSGRH